MFFAKKLTENPVEEEKIAQNLGKLALLQSEMGDLIGKIDHVTRFPNRIQFIDDLESALASGEDCQDKVLLLCTLADARHYNEILRALGHAYSEEFVRQGAARIVKTLPAGQNVYHVSVLSFATILSGHDRDAVEWIAEELGEAFETPIICQTLPVMTTIGTGLSAIADNRSNPAELLRSCLAAAQDSRMSERGWSWYNQKSDEAHLRAFRILTDLGAAIAGEGQLSLNFQPRIDMRTGRCVSAEALIRWNHPDLGFVSPGEFIPLAETTALITPLTHWVVGHAIEQAAKWRAGGIDITISVNISPINLTEPDFVDLFVTECDRCSIPPSAIEFEFTEGTLSPNSQRMFKTLDELKKLDVEISIDDFGSGYSNMSYLTNLPARTLKIDQSFIRVMDDDPRRKKLVHSIIELGHNLGYRLVAEGIETKSAYDELVTWGCDEGQGYLMSKPLPFNEFETWYKAASVQA